MNPNDNSAGQPNWTCRRHARRARAMDGERQPSKENTCLHAARPHRQAACVLRLFVYGTLKRGYWNHDGFCRGVLDVQEAVVRGRLYEMPSGIPVLQVPEEDILAHGTADPLADVATCLRADTHRQAQAHLAGHLASYLELMPDKSAGQRIWTCQRHAWRARAMDGERQSATAGDWGHVVPEGDGGGTSRDRNHACLALLDEIPIQLEKSRQWSMGANLSLLLRTYPGEIT